MVAAHSNSRLAAMARTMQERIRRSRPEFDDEGGFNGEAFTQAESQESKIVIGGMILLVDIDPAIVKRFILHELGHVIAPRILYGNHPNKDSNRIYEIAAIKPYDRAFPFHEQIRELAKIAKPYDVSCILEMAKNKNLAEQAKFCKEPDDWRGLARVATENPYADTGLLRNCVALDSKCEPSTFDEGFADWFAAKVLGDSAKSSTLAMKKKDIWAMASEFCAGEEVGKMHESAADAHPKYRVRLNEILFGQPEIRKIMGCPAEKEEDSLF
jgi:hypothetical protein